MGFINQNLYMFSLSFLIFHFLLECFEVVNVSVVLAFIFLLLITVENEFLDVYFFEYRYTFGGIILLYLSLFVRPSFSKLPAQLWRFYKEENNMVRTLQMVEKTIWSWYQGQLLPWGLPSPTELSVKSSDIFPSCAKCGQCECYHQGWHHNALEQKAHCTCPVATGGISVPIPNFAETGMRQLVLRAKWGTLGQKV